jgi:hypothetical protein
MITIRLSLVTVTTYLAGTLVGKYDTGMITGLCGNDGIRTYWFELTPVGIEFGVTNGKL